MDLIGYIQSLVQCVNDDPNILQRIEDLFGTKISIATIYDIVNNKPLFAAFCRANCRKYTNLLDALDVSSRDSIVLHVVNLSLYGVFDSVDACYMFCRDVANEMMIDDNMRVSIWQIILLDHPQKVVFVAAPDAHIGQIRAHVNDYLNEDITVKYNGSRREVTVNIVADNFAHSKEIYTGLHSHIHKKDQDLACKMHHLPAIRDREYSYINPDVTSAINAVVFEEMIHKLKSGRVNNIAAAPPATRKGIAENWVVRNPPDHLEVTKDYYDRYAAATHDPLANNIFGPIIFKVTGIRVKQGADGKRRYIVGR